MPPLSQSDLSSGLLPIFSNVGPDASARGKADEMAAAIYDYCTSGIPQCVLMTEPGDPGGISGTGMGGIDKPAPGTGLDQSKLAKGLEAAQQNSDSVQKSADLIAGAVHSYFSQARIKTNDSNGGPPGITGKGGIDKSSPGKGLSSAKKDFADALFAVYSDVSGGATAQQKAEQLAAAIHAFCQEGRVETSGTFAAPPIGLSFGPGAGTSRGEIL